MAAGVTMRQEVNVADCFNVPLMILDVRRLLD